MINVEKIFLPESQSFRVLLRNELGHIVHDLKMPLVYAVESEDKKTVLFKPADVDGEIRKHVQLHEQRHKVFLEAAAKHGITPEQCRDCK